MTISQEAIRYSHKKDTLVADGTAENLSPTTSPLNRHRFKYEAMAGLTRANQQVFDNFSSTSIEPLKYSNIHMPFEALAVTQPGAIAVEYAGQKITYGQLNRQAEVLAAELSNRGIGIGDCVPLYLERSIAMVVGIMAILKVGAAYVPQHVGVAPESQLKFVLEKTNASLALTLQKFSPVVESLGDISVISIDEFILTLDDDLLHEYAPPVDRPLVRPSVTDRCMVLFTSGTTGHPNGVQVTHRNLCNILTTAPGNLGIKPGMKVSQLLSISFDMAAWEILGCLSNGGTLLIRGKDLEETAKRADVIIATPTILSRFDPDLCSAVKVVAVAGEPCPKPLADRWAKQCDFYNSCGPTETTIVNTMKLHTHSDDVLSIGKPTPNNTVYILDENQQPCAIGDTGEMWAGGFCVTKGYLGNDRLTAERYRPDPFLGENHIMFNTRDLGRWLPNGNLEHLGRTDDQVKIRGFRVELDSVSAILESQPHCTRAVTLKLDNQTLVGFVEPRSVDTTAATEAVQEKLPYYCTPGLILAIDSLPMTSRGKIDKRLLLEMANDHLQHKNQLSVLDTDDYKNVALPAAAHTISAKLTHHRFYHYWRLLATVALVNIGFLFYGMTAGNWWSASGIHLAALSNLVVVNITLAIVMRQQYVINFLFKVATSMPHHFPLKLRQLMGKVYHFGGIHIGGSVAGTVWMIIFLISLGAHHAFELPGSAISSATTAISATIAVLLCIIVAMALPKIRSQFHNQFEWVHRFGGWSVLALFWVQTLLFIHDQHPSESLSSALTSSVGFWGLVIITISILLPWLRLRKVPVEYERPSDHVVLARFDYGVTPFAGSATTISRNPLMEWHSFANVPEPGRDGYRLTISRAGDWTGRLIDDLPSHLWVKGIPTAGVGNVDQLFRRVVWVTTGSGIGPALPHLLAQKVPAHLVWSTRNPRKTYGDKLVDEILDVEPNALIWDTDEQGRPDLVQLSYAAVQAFDAEAVIVIANEKLTRLVVHGMESRGIPAYGAIWDS